LERFRPELRGTGPARSVARYLVVPPGLSPAERLACAPIVAAGIGLLPEWARRALWLAQPPGADALVVQPTARALLALIRWASGAASDRPEP